MAGRIRDPIFDVGKFIAMFMVVLWHLLDWTSDVRSEIHYLVNFIIAVNMPLFFCISGCFARSMIERMDTDKLVRRLILLMWPVLVFGCIEAVFEFCEQKILFGEIPITALKRILFTAWFFYALAWCDIIVFFAYKMVRSKWAFFASYLFVLILPTAPILWNKSPVSNMLPFYLFGLCFLNRTIKRVKFNYIGSCCFGVYLLCVFCGGNFWQNDIAFYTNYVDLYHFALENVVSLIVRIILGISGVIGILWLLKSLIRIFPKIMILAPLGQVTLGMYFVSGMIIQHVLWNLGMRHYTSIPIVITETVLVYILGYLLLLILKRSDGLNKWVFGEGLQWPVMLVRRIINGFQ